MSFSIDDCLVPDWPAPPNVRALMTTRAGGVSVPPWNTLNLGIAVGDDPDAVRENRARLRSILPADPRWLLQVHGDRVVDALQVIDLERADASHTDRPGIVCVVQTADCLPVLFTDRAGTRVAAAHAGWRGLAAGILENTVAALATDPSDLLAWLGPAIGPTAFEVGDEVRAAFVAASADAADAFVPHGDGKCLGNLHRLARQRLATAGVRNVSGGDLCTVSDPARFFSHRRDRVSGRMAALVWIDGARC